MKQSQLLFILILWAKNYILYYRYRCYRYRYRPIWKSSYRYFIGIGRYEKKLIGRTLDVPLKRLSQDVYWNWYHNWNEVIYKECNVLRTHKTVFLRIVINCLFVTKMYLEIGTWIEFEDKMCFQIFSKAHYLGKISWIIETKIISLFRPKLILKWFFHFGRSWPLILAYNISEEL